MLKYETTSTCFVILSAVTFNLCMLVLNFHIHRLCLESRLLNDIDQSPQPKYPTLHCLSVPFNHFDLLSTHNMSNQFDCIHASFNRWFSIESLFVHVFVNALTYFYVKTKCGYSGTSDSFFLHVLYLLLSSITPALRSFFTLSFSLFPIFVKILSLSRTWLQDLIFFM